MLNFIRERAQGWIAWIIIILIIIPFALWGINEYFGIGGSINAAVVNGKEISLGQYQQAYQQQRERVRAMFGENFDPSLLDKQIRQDVIDGLVEDEVLFQAGVDEGYRISDSLLVNQIQSFDRFQMDGKFSKEIYETQIKSQGFSSGQYESLLRRGLLVNQQYTGISSSGFVTQVEIDQYLKLKNQQRKLGYLTVSAAKFGSSISPSDADVEKYYKDNKERFMTPEQVTLEYLELDGKALAQSIQPPSEQDLKRVYDEQIDSYSVREQRKLRHILVEVAQGSDEATVTAAKNKIDSIYKRVIAGEAFEKVAKESSEDLGSSKSGGDLGLVTEGSMDKAFDAAAFKLAKGKVSEPVRSEFGYHIIQVDQINPGSTKPFSEVRAKLAQDYQQTQAEKLYFEKAEALANLVYENADTLQVAADQLGMTIKGTGMVSRMGGAGIAANPKVVNAAFSSEVLKERLNSEPIEISTEHVVVVRVKEHVEARPRILDDVRADIVSLLKREQASEKAKSIGEELMARLKKGDDAEALAKEFTVIWKKPVLVGREDKSIDNAIVSDAFRQDSSALPAVKGLKLSSGDYVVYRLESVESVKADQADVTKQQEVMSTLAGTRSNLDYNSYLSSLREQAAIIINSDQL